MTRIPPVERNSTPCLDILEGILTNAFPNDNLNIHSSCSHRNLSDKTFEARKRIRASSFASSSPFESKNPFVQHLQRNFSPKLKFSSRENLPTDFFPLGVLFHRFHFTRRFARSRKGDEIRRLSRGFRKRSKRRAKVHQVSGFTAESAAILSISISIRRILNHNLLYSALPLSTATYVYQLLHLALGSGCIDNSICHAINQPAIDFFPPSTGYYSRMTDPRRTRFSFVTQISRVSLSLSLSCVVALIYPKISARNIGGIPRSRPRSKRHNVDILIPIFKQ